MNLCPLPFASVAAGLPVFTAAAERASHLIVIMTDDQGYNDVGFNGGTDLPTPHLDSGQ